MQGENFPSDKVSSSSFNRIKVSNLKSEKIYSFFWKYQNKKHTSYVLKEPSRAKTSLDISILDFFSTLFAYYILFAY